VIYLVSEIPHVLISITNRFIREIKMSSRLNWTLSKNYILFYYIYTFI